MSVAGNDTNVDFASFATSFNSSQSAADESHNVDIDIIRGVHHTYNNLQLSEMPNVNIVFTNIEIEKITKQLATMVVITQIDQKYHMALNDMRKSNFISLVVEPSFFGHHQATLVLTVATEKCVHIFDIVALGKIFKEVKEILEAPWPHKILHDSRRIYDNLRFNQNIQLHGIFDTLVVQCKVQGVYNNRTLAECIEKSLGVPQYYFIKEIDSQKAKLEKTYSERIFMARPLTSGQRRYLAKLAVYQYKLYKYLMSMIVFDKTETDLCTPKDLVESDDEAIDALLQSCELKEE